MFIAKVSIDLCWFVFFSSLIHLIAFSFKEYSRNLEEDVKDDVSGYFKRFLVSLMAANRQENQPPDHNRAMQQARVCAMLIIYDFYFHRFVSSGLII